MKAWLLFLALLVGVTLAHGQSSKTPIYNGILQSDLNAAGYKILSANLSDYAGTGVTWNSVTGKFDASSASVVTQDVGDASATIAAGTDVVRLTTPLTAQRTMTIPLASAYGTAGRQTIRIIDPLAVASAAGSFKYSRSGSDTINGVTSQRSLVDASTTGSAVFLTSDGVSKWRVSYAPGGAPQQGQVWMSSSPAVATSGWSPTTFPAGLATLGNVITGDGTNWISAPPAGGGGGNVSNSGTPTAGQMAVWTDATHIQGVINNSLNWDTAYSRSGQWTGEPTILNPTIGQSSLGLLIGTNVEAWDTDLDVWATKTPYAGAVTVTSGKTFNCTGNLTLAGTDGSTLNVGSGGTLGTAAYTASSAYQPASANLTTWASITPAANVATFLAGPSSATLRGALTDENGTGAALFSGATAPDFTTGFTIGAAAAAGKIPMGNGTNYVPSTPTWPTTAGTAGYTIRSDGTNIGSYPQDMMNASTASVTSSYNADTYLVGSSVVVAAGDFKLKGQYHCVFDMQKLGAGTGIVVITVRAGTAGTTGDTAIMTFTFGAGTGVSDLGVFDVWVNIRTTGASATSTGTCLGRHNLATTGIFSNAAVFTVTGAANASFNQTTATTIGLSFTGGTTFTGTNTFVQATLVQ